MGMEEFEDQFDKLDGILDGIQKDILFTTPENVENRIAPDLVGAVIGYRAWRLSSGLHILGSWHPGENIAECTYRPGHRPPEKNCGCGLYAYHKLGQRPGYGNVYAAIKAWGRISVAGRGYRAQKAEIIAISTKGLNQDEVDAGEAGGGRVKYIDLYQLAQIYDVPVIGYDRLEEYASNFGSVVPKSLRPGGNKIVKKKLASQLTPPAPSPASTHQQQVDPSTIAAKKNTQHSAVQASINQSKQYKQLQVGPVVNRYHSPVNTEPYTLWFGFIVFSMVLLGLVELADKM